MKMISRVYVCLGYIIGWVVIDEILVWIECFVFFYSDYFVILYISIWMWSDCYFIWFI